MVAGITCTGAWTREGCSLSTQLIRLHAQIDSLPLCLQNPVEPGGEEEDVEKGLEIANQTKTEAFHVEMFT